MADNQLISKGTPGGITIQDEDVDVAKVKRVSYAGAGVSAANDPTNQRVIVTIPGGGASTLSSLTIDANKDWNAKAITNMLALSLKGGADSFLLLPVLTTAQRDALTPSAGMLIYNSSTSKIQAYSGSAWNDVFPPAFGSPVSTGSSNTDGTATTAPRSDHVHIGRLLASLEGGASVGPRPKLNFIDGGGATGITITVADDPTNDRINVTLSVP